MPKAPSRKRAPAPAKKKRATEGPQAAPADHEVKITAAKGRPMLTWVGKRPLRQVTAFPAQRVEVFDPAGDAKRRSGGLLYHGDNKEVLAHLLANGFRGKVDLVYIDPPFDSGADYVRKVTLRGPKGTAKLDGESYTLGEQIQYTDIWANDNYLQFMYERLLLLKELLSASGTIFVHTNQARTHLVRSLLDEVFGAEGFRNDIVWKRGPGKSHPKYFGRVKDTILFYATGVDYTWNKQFRPLTEEYTESFRKKDDHGYYVTQPLHSGKPAKNVPKWKGVLPPDGRGWAYKVETLNEFEEQGLVEWSKEGVPRLKRYLDDIDGAVVQDVWDDIPPVLDRGPAHSGFPTEKPPLLIERMIVACTNSGGLVLDCFIGSGTTAAVAQKLGRRWIGCDINKGAIQTTSKRLQTIIAGQIETTKRAKQIALGTAAPADDETPPPAQLSFETRRVNDYDLQIQHNEAVNLACEHIGVERMRTDSFFDGVRGKRLVKVIPFNHPLTPLDLDELRREIEGRPTEDRDVLLVCLGKDPASDPWLADWNRHRKGKGGVNRIDVIELRTDPQYGKFFEHKPAQARVRLTKKGEVVAIEIVDFVSPSIIERLSGQAELLAPRVDDWRAMVDCVLIDPDYDGEIFRIAISDVPARKTDLVVGRYEIERSRFGAHAGVKLIDMLGEEVLIVLDV
jgi:adenine-specific DNA-methyltransferase